MGYLAVTRGIAGFANGGKGVDPAFPIDLLYVRGCLWRRGQEGWEIAERRRDSAAIFASLGWRLWGQPFAGIDMASRRLVPPSSSPDDVEHRRIRQGDDRSYDGRAEEDRLRFEAMHSIADRRPDRAYVLYEMAVRCRPLSELATSVSRQMRYLGLLLDALDAIGDRREVERVADILRASRSTEAAPLNQRQSSAA